MIEQSISAGLLILGGLAMVTAIYRDKSEGVLAWPQEDDFWAQALFIGFAGFVQSGLLSAGIHYILEATFCIGLFGECTPDPTPGERQAAIILPFLALIWSPIPSRLAGVSWPAAVGLGLLFFPLTLATWLPGGLLFFLIDILIDVPNLVAIALSFSILWVGAPILISVYIRNRSETANKPEHPDAHT